VAKIHVFKGMKAGWGGDSMGIWKLKNCPRCRGDMFLDSDMDGWYEQCMQCSYRKELKTLVELREKIGQTKKGEALRKNSGSSPSV
jgi:hypothetical protein